MPTGEVRCSNLFGTTFSHHASLRHPSLRRTLKKKMPFLTPQRRAQWSKHSQSPGRISNLTKMNHGLNCNSRYLFNQEIAMPDSRYMTKACSECQQNFKTSRGHAKYCSARCRMRAMRRQGRVTVTWAYLDPTPTPA